MIFAFFVDIQNVVFVSNWVQDMSQPERRKHERLPLQLDLLCQRVGTGGSGLYTGKTVNVSTGGILFHITDCKIDRDDLLNVELTVPPTEGLLELGGRVSTFARVLRIHRADSHSHHAVAAEFLQCPKFIE
jgi:hypothetical protein